MKCHSNSTFSLLFPICSYVLSANKNTIYSNKLRPTTIIRSIIILIIYHKYYSHLIEHTCLMTMLEIVQFIQIIIEIQKTDGKI